MSLLTWCILFAVGEVILLWAIARSSKAKRWGWALAFAIAACALAFPFGGIIVFLVVASW